MEKRASWIKYVFNLIVKTYWLNVFKLWRDVFLFFRDYKQYKSQNKNHKFKIWSGSLYPCLIDRTENTPLDYVYIYQDSWAIGKVLSIKPRQHYDIGSKVEMVWGISSCIPTTMIDIRKVEIGLPWLNFLEWSILDLPLKDDTIESLSAICVIEHIWLWRYWDPLDPFGSEKSFKEVKRVLKAWGHLIFSVPVDKENTVYFNAHRAFTREYVMEMMDGFTLQDEKYIYWKDFMDHYSAEKWTGVWCYYFIKN
jgi:SAM-dependent methyltransferase